MHKPVILLDCDGVLVNHQEQNLAQLNHAFGTSYTMDYVTSFDYSNFPNDHAAYLRALWYKTSYDEDILTESQLETIEGLRSLGRVVVCSSPLVGHADSKLQFLQHYFDPKDIIFARDKNLLDAEILIDDAPHQLAGFDGHAIIYDQPWNRLIAGARAFEFDDIGPLVISYLMTCSDYDLS